MSFDISNDILMLSFLAGHVCNYKICLKIKSYFLKSIFKRDLNQR